MVRTTCRRRSVLNSKAQRSLSQRSIQGSFKRTLASNFVIFHSPAGLDAIMCTQHYLKYSCGCKLKGEFAQCDRLFESNLNLQCDATRTEEKTCRSYCAQHLVKESKATVAYQRGGGKS